MQKLLIIMHGFQASGKSTTARLLGKELTVRVVATHQIRTEIATKETAYSEQMTNKVYNVALELAGILLDVNKTVIIDAMFARRSQRNLAYQLAEKCGAGIVVIHCVCPDIKIIRQRVKNRRKSNLPEDEGDKMEYYYRTKALTELLEEDITPSGGKPIVLTVDTCNFGVVPNDIQDNLAGHLVETITSALLEHSKTSAIE